MCISFTVFILNTSGLDGSMNIEHGVDRRRGEDGLLVAKL